MAEIIAFFITLGIFVGLPAWIIWSVITRNNKKSLDKEKLEPVLEWANYKGYPLPDKPYGCLFTIAIICGFAAGLIPGFILCYFAQKREDSYKKEMRLLTTKWIDEGKPLIGTNENKKLN